MNVNRNTLIDLGLANIELWEEIYAKYKSDPNSVDISWRNLFSAMEAEQRPSTIASKEVFESAVEKISSSSQQEAYDNLRIFLLMQAYRTHGYLMAQVDPLATEPSAEPLNLQLNYLGFRTQELMQLFPTRGLLKKEKATLQEIIDTLRAIYCGKFGIEYMNLQGGEFERWIQEKIELPDARAPLTIEQKQMIIQYLNKSELFESFLHTKYVGQKRFSIEGGETLIPMMAAVIETGANLGVEDFIVGMSHRGRLNVLSNIMNKSYAEVFVEFEENYIPTAAEGQGDVKYHKGFSSELLTTEGHRVNVSLTANPSHLESVDAVVEGQVRAKLSQKQDLDEKKSVLPVLVHGDAAIAGQGVVYETLQLSGLKGYSTGGTLHIVINNHIGFTTLPEDLFSTRTCTDIARTFGAPVFHVNAEDPESCIFVTNLAVEIRQKFHCDVFIDLNCYRKYGHNEGDEPTFTQPVVYQLIKQKQPIRDKYRDQLIQEGILEKFLVKELEEDFKKALQLAQKGIKISQEDKEGKIKYTLDEEAHDKNLFTPVETGVPFKTLRSLAEKFSTVPKDFHIHPKLEKSLKEHLLMVQEGPESKPLDWGMAETLAYASLLNEGTPIRLTGQDTSRGTFSHRHAMWVDQTTQATYIPLAHLKPDQASFDLYNSPLSEFAALGFEYGYSLFSPESLVIWEAQFGDFANGAQVITDQYISSAEQKWGRKANLVLFLPHGFEGQGPEHSSARIERFLNLAGHDNMFVVYPTQPDQFFHLLRRQIKSPVQKPLIVFTPKGLLRHPECVSPMAAFTRGSFQEILDDSNASDKVTRLAFCTGRIYYDLTAERKKTKTEDIALIRIEQLYPLHKEKIREIIGKYKNVKRYLWVQEEPFNMGAWHYLQSTLPALLPKGAPLEYIGRARSASPATGFYYVHKQEHALIMNAIFPNKQNPFYDVEYLQRV